MCYSKSYYDKRKYQSRGTYVNIYIYIYVCVCVCMCVCMCGGQRSKGLNKTPMCKLANFISLNWRKVCWKTKVTKSFHVRKNICPSVNISREKVKIHILKVIVFFNLKGHILWTSKTNAWMCHYVEGKKVDNDVSWYAK